MVSLYNVHMSGDSSHETRQTDSQASLGFKVFVISLNGHIELKPCSLKDCMGTTSLEELLCDTLR
jgi:hypothetical protein